MSGSLTGKYLDGAGLSKVWEKVKSYSSNNYLPLSGGTISGNLTVGGTLNASGTLNVGNKIVIGDPVNTLASDSTVTDPYEKTQGLISYVPAYFTKTINCNTISTESIIVGNNKTGFLKANGTIDDTNYLPLTGGAISGNLSTSGTLSVTGEATFTNNVTAKGFKVGNQTGFLKANGTIDDTNYLPLTGGELTGSLTTEGLIAKNGLFVGRDTGDNVWDALVGLNYQIGYFTGQTEIASGLTEKDVFISIIPANGVEYGHIDITGPVNMNGSLSTQSITLSSSITQDTQATTKKYVDDKVNTSLGNYLPLTGGTLTGSLNLTSAITQDTQATTKKYVDDKVSSSISTAISELGSVLEFKGSINSTSTLPTSAELGWTYMVSEGGTYAGEVCEVGDMIICTTASTTAPTWTIIQRNIPGALSVDDIDSICAN